jgi:predicted metal-dependent hydrolase
MSTNTTCLSIGEIDIAVTRKNIKNLHLAVYPPNGKVKISSPQHISNDSIRLFAVSKIAWIKKQQKKILSQERQTKREYISGESHYYQGQRYLLKVVYENQPPKVCIKNGIMELTVRPGSGVDKKRSVMNEWYRKNLKEIVAKLLDKWIRKIGVKPRDWTIRFMRTKWGSCNSEKNSILLNLELAKKSIRCVHELVHLLERNHNKKFIAYMDKYLPGWRLLRDELNSSPLAHENWKI